MRRTNARILGTASLLALAFTSFPAVAYAQDTDEETTSATTASSEASSETSGAIVITGSRIRRPNLDSTVPITSVGVDDVMNSGDVSLGDQLNELPSLRNTFSTGNSTRFIGTAGLSLLDLRGLGTARTLVLVNNRRHVTASPGSFDVDVNTIPVDLLERVDIVTGGNSAIYGSDAIAGVVNFVLRRDFTGIRVRGQSGISQEGDRSTQFVSATGGWNFASGRGNIAVAFEYADTDPLYFTQRESITGAGGGRCQFQLVDTPDPVGGTDGVPDQQFLCGIRNANIYDGGQITTVGTCSALAEPIRSQRCLPNGQPRLFYFDPNGNLVEDPIIGQDFRPFGSGNAQTLNGSTLRNTGQLAAGVTRYTANLLLNYEASPAFRPFLEAKFVRVDSIQEGQPSFVQGFLSSFFGTGLETNLRCDNAFITPQIRAQLAAMGRCIGGPGVNIFEFEPGVLTEILPINRFNVDFGGRGELGQRDTYRIVAGFEGDFFDDWRYEVAVNYGRLRTRLQSLNNLLTDEFLFAVDATTIGGQIVCRDPAARAAGCVPLNLFGYGAPSQAALDYVNITSSRRQRASQFQASAFVSGTSSSFLNLPGGPIGFALGLEYRRETAFGKWSAEVEQGLTFLNAIQEFNPPALEIKEAFGEIRLPLLRDLPFVQELTVEAAGRVSDYGGSTGTVYAYNIGGTWAPVSDIRFRVNYSTSVRAPTLSDLFAPQSQNFAQIQDPCDVNFINNNANRAANCAADGVPVGFVNTPARSSSTSFLQGGNEFLTEERSRSWTAGAVIQPSFIPGLAITIDYYDISIDDLISVLTAQNIINQCYDSPSGINNPFCSIVFRNPDSTFEQPRATIAGPVNFAAFDARGIDFDVSYRKTFANGHRLDVRAIATRVLELTAYLSPSDPTFGNRFRSEVGDPSWQASFRVGYTAGPIELNYQLRYIGRQTIGAYENYFRFQGRPPQNADSTAEIWYPDVFYHNARLGYRIDNRFTFYAGVDNIGNRQPPLGLLGTGAGEPFDTIGRFFYAGVNVNFR